jgi:hypothetical protein
MCKRKRRRREGLRKRKRRKRKGEESLRDSGLDVCAVSSRRWLEKRRRAGAADVRPQFPLTWLHGRPDLTKKAVPAERLVEMGEEKEGLERELDGRRYFRREWMDRRVFHPCARLFQNFGARANNSTSCFFWCRRY